MNAFRHRGQRVFAAALFALLLLATPAAAADDESAPRANVGEIIFDILILRPLGMQATLGGFGAFLLVAPWLAPSQEVPYGWDTFVLGPFDYTFKRPVGEF